MQTLIDGGNGSDLFPPRFLVPRLHPLELLCGALGPVQAQIIAWHNIMKDNNSKGIIMKGKTYTHHKILLLLHQVWGYERR
jgi:hypothetical protein